MDSRRRFCRRLGVGWVTAIATLSLAAGTVDDFALNQAPLTTGVAAQAGTLLGGEREIRLAGGSGARAAEVALGELVFTHDAGATGECLVVWDGAADDPATTTTNGLGAFDLTAGGADAFLLGIDAATAATPLTLTVRTASGTATASVVAPAGAVPNALRIPFSSFSGPGDFRTVGAIELAVASVAAANSVRLDYLRTVSTTDPLPLVAQLTDVVLVDADADGRASAGDTLRYTLTLRNTGATELGAVHVSVPAPLDGTLTAGLAASPVARADEPTDASAPGESWHAAFNMPLSTGNLLANDFRGAPGAMVASFGGGTLGGAADSHPAGAPATVDGHTLQVNADGSFSYTPKAGFVGRFSFEYKIANLAGTSTATATIAVGTRPAVGADSYAVTGNTALSTSLIAQSVLANDAGSSLAITNVGAPAQGTLTLVPETGFFTYEPAADFIGTDSFTYTIANGLGSATGTVTLGVTGRLWYVDNTAAPGGDGRSSRPFNSLPSFALANTGAAGHPRDGDVIFLRNTGVTYANGIILRPGQKLIGDGATGDFLSVFGFALAPGSAKAANVALPPLAGIAPVIANTSGHGITFPAAGGNTVRGVTVGNTPSGYGFFGAAVGNLTITECSKVGTGGIANLAGGALAVALNTAAASASAQGIRLVGTTGAFAATGGSIAGATSDAIYLENAAGVSLAGMNIANNLGSGIHGTTVGGLTLTSCTFSNNGDATDGSEANLWFSELTGTATLTNCTLSASIRDNFRLRASAGPLLTLTLAGTEFTTSRDPLDGDGFTWEGSGAAQADITATNCVFTDNGGTAFAINATDTSDARVTIAASTFRDNGRAITFSADTAAKMRFHVHDNGEIVRSQNTAVAVIAGTTATSSCTIDGTIANNTVGGADADSGSRDDYGIALDLRGQQVARLAVAGNSIRHTDKTGIWVSSAEFGALAGGKLDLTLTGNTVGKPDDNGVHPYGSAYSVMVDARHTTTLTTRIDGNAVDSGVGVATAIFVRQRDSALFKLEALALGDQTAPAAVEAAIEASNTAAATAEVATKFTGVTTGSTQAPALP